MLIGSTECVHEVLRLRRLHALTLWVSKCSRGPLTLTVVLGRSCTMSHDSHETETNHCELTSDWVQCIWWLVSFVSRTVFNTLHNFSPTFCVDYSHSLYSSWKIILIFVIHTECLYIPCTYFLKYSWRLGRIIFKSPKLMAQRGNKITRVFLSLFSS